MNLLIVDDDIELLEQLCKSLEKKRYRVETAVNGEQALISCCPALMA